MKNLISAEFYKMTKSKSFIVCNIVACLSVLLIIACCLLMEWAMNIIDENYEEPDSTAYETEVPDYMDESIEETAEEDVYMFGVSEGSMNAQMQLLSGTYDGKFILSQAFSFTSIQTIIAIFISIFIAGEFSNGTIKMQVSRGYTRNKIFFAKMIAGNFAGLFMAVITCIVAFGISSLIWGVNNPKLGTAVEAKDIVMFFVIQILLNAAITTMFISFSMIFRNLGLAIAMSIIVCSCGSMVFMVADGIIYLICSLADISIRKLPFMPSELWILTTIANMSKYSFKTKDIIMSLGVMAGYAGIFGVIGNRIFNKKDIK